MSKVYYLKVAESDKYEQILEQELKNKFKKGMKVAVKLHMGEDKGMFNPTLAKRTIKVLNKLGCEPFLFDTPVTYPGARESKQVYEKTAVKHGFTKESIGCPVIISDDYVGVKTKNLDLEVSKELLGADAFLVLTHFKGHPASGMGGAIKNIAMGCVSPKSKKDQHTVGIPVVSDECTACGTCEEVCEYSAIKVKDKAVINKNSCWACTTCVYNCPSNAIKSKASFDALMTEAASGILKKFDDKPVFYVNDVRSITKNCDCFSNPGKIIAKDVGIFMSDNLVAVEKASTDLVKKQEGRDVFLETHHHDPYLQIKQAEKLGLGKEDYELT
ncbi:hypothetical protein AYK26_04955 [Euryarchaeota archaeon SM23-78]|nr:MAG: hypothetical protein AYK26_04955 [Euryarchaeota archaeon SM23-78]MBW3000918.1 DUF362 domain-containing protein [Candidatus Woesearchaeota archaeon]